LQKFAEIREINKFKSIQNDYIFSPVSVETSGTIVKKCLFFFALFGPKIDASHCG